MDSTAQPGRQADANLAEAIDRLWTRFLPEMRERVSILASASSAVSAKTLTGQECKAAQAAAHKLAGVLGTFGLTAGTVLARKLEMHFSREGGPDSDFGPRLVEVVNELQSMIESRSSFS